MASTFDETEFVDRDVQTAQAVRLASNQSGAGSGIVSRPPTREELEARATDAQKRLAELKRAQEEVERERAKLEESRRRRAEFETGRGEMLQSLTRGIGLMEEATFRARRDAEQLGKTLADFQDVLGKLKAINESEWTQEAWEQELTRALTTIENARMEWNSARLKWPLLDGKLPASGEAVGRADSPATDWLAGRSLADLAKTGLALTWPVAAAMLVGVIMLLILLLR
jgi:chromosome segregation ATPase